MGRTVSDAVQPVAVVPRQDPQEMEGHAGKATT